MLTQKISESFHLRGSKKFHIPDSVNPFLWILSPNGKDYHKFFLIFWGASFLVLIAYFAIFPLPYAASAYLFLSSIKPVVTFDTRIQETSQKNPPQEALQKMDARKTGIIELIPTGAIALRVIATLGEKIKPLDRNPDHLLRKVRVQAVKNSDLVSIKVEDRDREYAALLATTWAQEAETYINTIFNRVRSEPFVALKRELERTKAEFESAQNALEEHIRTSKLDVYQQRLPFLQESLSSILQEYKGYILTNLKQRLQMQQARALDLLSQSSDLNNLSRSQILNEKIKLLSFLYSTKIQLELTLKNLRAFEKYLQTSQEFDPLSTQYTLLLLKASIFSMGGAASLGSTQFQIPNSPPPQMTRDLALQEIKAMKGALESQLNQTSQELEQAKEELKTWDIPKDLLKIPEDTTYGKTVLEYIRESQLSSLSLGEKIFNMDFTKRYEPLMDRVRELQTLIEQESIKRKFLSQKRDLALEAYNTVLRKLEELRVSEGTFTLETKMVSPAVVPASRKASSSLLWSLLAFFSFFASALATLALAFLKNTQTFIQFLFLGTGEPQGISGYPDEEISEVVPTKPAKPSPLKIKETESAELHKELHRETK